MSSGVPVFQPPHLEGDPSLATEILPGPPSVASTQQSILKRDPRKPSTVFSYLPPSDPGSTYSGIMHGTLIGHEQDATRVKRSKTAIGRAQRASARNQNGLISRVEPAAEGELASASTSNPIPVDFESDTMVIEDEPSISRSNSSQNLQEVTPVAAAGRPKRKDKGKAKEVETPVVRVKEEPKPVSLHTPDPPLSNLLNNDDHCSSCRSNGALVYCDGCPRAFHLWCLDPPMESVDEGDSRWFCPSCTIRKHPPRKPPPSLLSPLVHQVDLSIPTEFQLPEDVRTFFREVGTGPKGTYVDTSEIKPPRLNRHGQLEDREPYRLRDRNGAPVLCFRCGTSALPGSLAASAPAAKRARRSSTVAKAPPDAWKSIVSCDYCSLHWHLDCLDPPLSTMPPFTKKWMCPNHAERILPPKRRIPKHNVPPIEITKPRQFNNGNIEIIHPEVTRVPHTIPSHVAVDEVLINGRRYRVPERVIVLDFWNKLNKAEHQADKDSNPASGMSSPLTSLSSLDDLDDHTISELPPSPHDPDDLKVAQMLCSLQLSKPRVSAATSTQFIPNGSSDTTLVGAGQSGSEQPTAARSGRVIRLPKKSTDASSTAPTKASGTNGTARAPPKAQRNVGANEYQPASGKRKKQTQPPQPEPSTRELRSRSKNYFDSSLTSISSRSSMKRADDSSRDSMVQEGPMSAPLPPPTAAGKSRSFHVKLEETDHNFALGSTSAREAEPSSEVLPKPRRARGAAHAANPSTGRNDSVANPAEAKEKRGKKRKERDDELPQPESKDLVEMTDKSEKEKREKKPRKKSIRTPARRGHVSPAADTAVTATPASGAPSTAAPATPSLKIRLPRLNNSSIHASPSIPNTNGDTPTRL
ncbi:putative PHD-finger [Lyophyllum shimeji]|uniref:PHD-finger n=1 Tax=Lyophyllum shimeji TaxID=47721 RepID=A0A9P3UJ18_LYOSH|nr:putative PHD-finger [Lyophyllum shimeji]